MNEEPFENKEQEDLFKEQALLAGFKLVSTRKFSDLPKDKPAFLLLTKNESLLKNLRRWVNGIVILYNPEEYNYIDFKKLYALVIDEELLEAFPYQDLIKEKYVKAEIDLDLLKSILSDLRK